MKRIGIVGLGLIGGSLAKAYKQNCDCEIFALDTDATTLGFAQLSCIVDGILNEKTIPTCEAVFIALYPKATVDFLQKSAPVFAKKQIIIDLCGTKKQICEVGFDLAKKYGFTFVGGHPMAGKHVSGFKNASADLFKGAPMVIVPPRYDDIELLDAVKQVLSPCRFGSISVTDADNHDKVIAFTSQLAHIVSSAYVKSPTANVHKGFSAGSYKDLTRVAWLNENMWTELFLENKEPLLFEIETIIKNLSDYRNAIANGDKDTLRSLLKDGRIAKENIDGK